MSRKLVVVGALAAILIAGPDPARGQAEMGTAFTYQGRIEDAGGPITDTCDFEFSLWDAASGGGQVGDSPQPTPSVAVNDGLFTVTIDFDAGAFNGEARWLEMAVCCPSPCAVETLDPRQELTPAPHALTLPGFYTTHVPDGFYIGVNVIGGFSENSVEPGVLGATISGGGRDGMFPSPNVVSDDHGTIGGGYGNLAGGGGSPTSTVATVGGGAGNRATGHSSTIGGGTANEAAGSYSTVSGGQVNTASGVNAVVPGGAANQAGGHTSFAAGYCAKVRDAVTVGDADGDEGTFVWADSTHDLGNRFTSTGPNQFLISAAGGVGIGTNSPEYMLQVGGDTDDAVIMLGKDPQLLINRDTANGNFRIELVGDTYSSNVLQLGRTDGNHEIVITGKTGIGRNPLANKLEVEGNASKTAGGSWLANSDARIKTDINRIDNALETIGRLRPVRFKYTDEYRT